MVIFDKLPEAPDKSRLVKNGCPWGKKPTMHRGQTPAVGVLPHPVYFVLKQ